MSIQETVEDNAQRLYVERTDSSTGGLRALGLFVHARGDMSLDVSMHAHTFVKGVTSGVRLSAAEAEWLLRWYAKRRGWFISEQPPAPAYTGAGDDDKAGADAPEPTNTQEDA